MHYAVYILRTTEGLSDTEIMQGMDQACILNSINAYRECLSFTNNPPVRMLLSLRATAEQICSTVGGYQLAAN
jgi:hypothetical protein